MTKSRKQRRKRKKPSPPSQDTSPADVRLWHGVDGVHFSIPGRQPSASQLASATERYQEGIRNSPLWDEMVAEFGIEKAEQLLKQCRVEPR